PPRPRRQGDRARPPPGWGRADGEAGAVTRRPPGPPVWFFGAPLGILNAMGETQEGKSEIERLPSGVRIIQRGPLWIAVPTEEGPPLSEATVEQVLRRVREGGEKEGPASQSPPALLS